jgi:hypothetical protein
MGRKKPKKKPKQRLGPAPATILRGGVHADKRRPPRSEAERRAVGEQEPPPVERDTAGEG